MGLTLLAGRRGRSRELKELETKTAVPKGTLICFGMFKDQTLDFDDFGSLLDLSKAQTE